MNLCLMCGIKFKSNLDYKKLFTFKNVEEKVICFSCMNKFKKIKQDNIKCLGCFKDATSQICADCNKWKKKYDGKLLNNKAIVEYNSAFHDVMVMYKRQGDYLMKNVLINLVKHEIPKVDFYVPIPSAKSHFEERKFDTIFEVFKDLVPLSRILINIGNEKAQGTKNRQERLATKQVFEADRSILLSGSVLLLDDIYTTGRTLYHARDAINSVYPNVSVKSFTISR